MRSGLSCTTTLAAAHEELQERRKKAAQEKRDLERIAEYRDAVAGGEMTPDQALEQAIGQEREEREKTATASTAAEALDAGRVDLFEVEVGRYLARLDALAAGLAEVCERLVAGVDPRGASSAAPAGVRLRRRTHPFYRIAVDYQTAIAYNTPTPALQAQGDFAMNDFGPRLRALREARGWTRYRLAKLAGLTNEGVVRVEAPGNDPKLSTLAKLAGAFGVEAWQLLEMASREEGRRRKRPGKGA
jgi:DNA-binding XRE family transcriptional regulator